MQLTSKELGDNGEAYACEILRAHGYATKLLHVNAKTYDIQASSGANTFFVSVKVSREKQHVRLGARRSVLGLSAGNFVFAFLPVPGGEIQSLPSSPHCLLVIPAEIARDDALSIHDPYWVQKSKDPNVFSVMVKGYGAHHKSMWPQWLEYRDGWHLLPQFTAA